MYSSSTSKLYTFPLSGWIVIVTGFAIWNQTLHTVAVIIQLIAAPPTPLIPYINFFLASWQISLIPRPLSSTRIREPGARHDTDDIRFVVNTMVKKWLMIWTFWNPHFFQFCNQKWAMDLRALQPVFGKNSGSCRFTLITEILLRNKLLNSWIISLTLSVKTQVLYIKWG